MSPPTPSGISTLSVLSPWNIAAMSQIGVVPPVDPNTARSAPTSKAEGGLAPKSSQTAANTASTNTTSNPPTSSSTTCTSAPILPQHVLSPHPNFTSIQSPLSYLHTSPLSPMRFIQSPYASSVSSCPSVSSSSGCSSDGGASFTTGLQKKHYAASEYHVGPRRPLCEKLTEEDSVSEGANSSGRNTPVDSREDEETMLNQSTSVITGHTSNSGVPTFTPFTITPQGPSITQPNTPHILMVHGSSGGNSSKPGSRGQSESRKTDSVDGTHQAVLYPYSVESVSHSVQPMSVDSSTHVS